MNDTIQQIMNKLYDWFMEHRNITNRMLEALDDATGYLKSERRHEMEGLNDYYENSSPLEIITDIWASGYDDDAKDHAPFNPDRKYYYVEDVGAIVSTNNNDYIALGLLTDDAIRLFPKHLYDDEIRDFCYPLDDDAEDLFGLYEELVNAGGL